MIPPDYFCGGCGRLIHADNYPSPDEPNRCSDCVFSDEVDAHITARHEDDDWDDFAWWTRSSRWTA